MDLASNRKARHDYHIIETFEAGIQLQGTEVKSCRQKQISLQEGHVSIEKEEAWLFNVHIAPYEQGNIFNHPPRRKRKLLLHKIEIRKIARAIEAKGMTLVPLNFHLTRGKIKVSIALCKGKDKGDKRETLKKRDSDMKLRRLSGKSI
jgi:SsrA-binding protein